MKLYAILLFACASLSAQITIPNPTAQVAWSCTGLNCTAEWRAGLGDTPYMQAYSIIDAGATTPTLTVTVDAGSDPTIAASFGNFPPQLCSPASNGDPCGTAATKAPAKMYIGFAGGTVGFAALTGPHTATLHVSASGTTCNGATTCDIQITYVGNAATSSTIKTLNGSTNGCRNNVFGYLDICDFKPDWSLGQGGTFTFPAAPGFYNDGNFGGAVQVLTSLAQSPRFQPFDAIVQPFSADNNYAATLGRGGSFFITSRATGADTLSGGIPAIVAMDPVNPKVYWSFGSAASNPLQVVKVDWSSGSAVSTVCYTYTGNATVLDNTTDCDVTNDGWLGLVTMGGTDHNLLLFDLKTCTGRGTVTPYIATHGQPIGRTQVEVLGGVDSISGKRYIWLAYAGAGNTYSEFYSFNPTTRTLAFEYTLPQHIYTPLLGGGLFSGPTCTAGAKAPPGGNCWSAGHTAVAMIRGQAYFVPVYQSQSPFYDRVAFLRINAGANLLNVPVEAGGGLTLGPIIAGDSGDLHIGCSDVGLCVLSRDQDPAIGQVSPTQFSDSLVSVSNTTPIVVHYSSSAINSFLTTTQSGGGSIVLGGVTGACANRVNGIPWTITNLNTAFQTFQLSGSTAHGACNAGTGGLIRNARPPQTSNQTGVWLIDARQIASKTFTITRLPNSRSFSSVGSISNFSYWQQAHCSISRDGTVVACNSGQLPDTVQVLLMQTGFPTGGRVL